jgi:hypothetical protein
MLIGATLSKNRVSPILSTSEKYLDTDALGPVIFIDRCPQLSPDLMRVRTRTFPLHRLAYSQPEAAEVGCLGLSQIKEALRCGELAEVEFPNSRRKLILHDDLLQYLLRHRVFRGSGDHHIGEIPADTPLPAEGNPFDRCRGPPPSIGPNGSLPPTPSCQRKEEIRAGSAA